jgi:hypothetical protein
MKKQKQQSEMETRNFSKSELECIKDLASAHCSSSLFIVMDAVGEVACRDVPWDMLHTDDLIIAEDHDQEKFKQWQIALENKGLKIKTSKTETMVCSKTDEVLTIADCKGNKLKQVEIFKYLGSVINAKGGCEEDVRHRNNVASQKWKELTGVLCG